MKVPALRFKEFTDVWIETSLGRVSDDVMYGMNAAASPYDGVNKYIRITDIDEETREFIPSPLCSPDGEVQDKFKLKKGDLVFARTGASVGKSYLYKEKDGNLLFAGFLVKFSVVSANPYFIYAKTLTESYKGWLAIMSMRSGQPGVNAEELKEFKFLAPSLIEQTKIANFLTAVDEKISLLTQKHDLLTQYKKGVMQQIFSQELRFKDDDGGDFPEWEERKLADILVEFSERTTVSNQHRILSSTTKGLFNQDEYFTRDIASKDNAGYKIIRKNQLVFSPQNLWLGNININTDFEIGIVSPSYKIFGFNENLSTANYCKYFLLTPQMLIEYEQCSEQGASVVRRNLDMNLFLKISIPLPSLTEQTKIANFLTAIDDKITTVQAQLDAVKQYKQGLLQQMFV